MGINHGNDTTSLLWAWLNFHYDDRFQLKVGRVFTPWGYEWYFVPTAFLINPERSLFYNNFGPGSDVGIYAWGRWFEKRLDYAVGIFNGTRNGFLDLNDSKDLDAFVNIKPFLKAGIPLLENLNVGGSVSTGNQNNAPNPVLFRTDTAVNFLQLNSNVRENGWRTLWDLHMAYYYRQLSVIAEWQSGFQDYALAGNLANRTHLPISGFYVQAGYFLTGETVAFRNVLQPNRPFDLRKGRRGPGAIELGARYSLLDIDRQIFTAGLSDPNNWTNRVYNVNVGLNWYLTKQVKIYLGWEHDVFGDPVLFAPGRRQLTSDQFLARFQFFF